MVLSKHAPHCTNLNFVVLDKVQIVMHNYRFNSFFHKFQFVISKYQFHSQFHYMKFSDMKELYSIPIKITS